MNSSVTLDRHKVESLTVLQRLVARLFFEREKISRNRNFEAFDDPEVQRAMRVARHLRSIVRDLSDESATFEISVDRRRPNDLRLVFRWAERDAQRTTWLTPDEAAVLKLDAEIAQRITLTNQ